MAKPPSQFGLSAKARRTVPQPINLMLRLGVGRDDLISLAAGLVDQESLPAEQVADLAGELLGETRAGRKALQYGDTAGLSELREELLEHICRLDGVRPEQMGVDASHLVIGSGSQQLLYILTDLLVDPGDVVVTEWPSYFVYSAALASLGAEVRAVEMDEQGMRLDALERLLAELEAEGRLERVKIVYTCDYHQNPTGITLAEDRRDGLLEIVRRYSRRQRICLIEDAAYRELTCDGRAPASIKSRESDNAQVVLAQTFSKPFSPGLRTGYVLLPDGLVGPVVDEKGNHDFGSSNFNQHLLLRAMRSGIYARHVEELRRRYRRKRDAMLAALDRHLGDLGPTKATWTRPGGGLYVYVSLPAEIETGTDSPLWRAALAEGVAYVPGEYCYGPDPRRRPERNHLRLTFATVQPSAIEAGVARLARAIRRVAGREGTFRGARPAPAARRPDARKSGLAARSAPPAGPAAEAP